MGDGRRGARRLELPITDVRDVLPGSLGDLLRVLVRQRVAVIARIFVVELLDQPIALISAGVYAQ